MESIDNRSIDVERVERRARIVYEWARLRRALIGFAPALLLVALAIQTSTRPSMTAPFAASVFGAGVLALWYGREPRRAVLPGVAAGLIPAGLTFCTMHLGHMCFASHCTSVCMAACILGGAGAALVVGRVAVRRRLGWRFWVSASALTVLTGALGCACLGYSGLAGLAVGYACGAVPGLAARWGRAV